MSKKLGPFEKIYQQNRLICNNSVNGGDCYGESYCESNCSHRPFWCHKHTINIYICQCCFAKCPACVGLEDAWNRDP